MTSPSDAIRRANLTGTLWMILSMAGFAVEDSMVKATAAHMPVGQVLLLFGVGGAIGFAILARIWGERLFLPEALSRTMIIRAGFEISGRLFYILALSLVPLSTATVILQATPLVVVAAAALIYKEQVGWRRWSAIFIGLIGVIIIIQPGAEGFSLLSLLAVIGMLGFAGRDLASRAAPAALGTSALGFYGFGSIIVAGLAFSIWDGQAFVMIPLQACLYLIGAVLSGLLAYSSLMKAMRTGEVSAVTPFRYTRLLFGVGLGFLLFREIPTLSVWIGSALIVTSGLFILWRGKTRTPR